MKEREDVLYLMVSFFVFPTISILFPDSDSSAALPGFLLSSRNRCTDARVVVHVTHICTCVLDCLCVSLLLTCRPGLRAAQTN